MCTAGTATVAAAAATVAAVAAASVATIENNHPQTLWVSVHLCPRTHTHTHNFSVLRERKNHKIFSFLSHHNYRLYMSYKMKKKNLSNVLHFDIAHKTAYAIFNFHSHLFYIPLSFAPFQIITIEKKSGRRICFGILFLFFSNSIMLD